MIAGERSREAQISAVAALDEPTRRGVYDYLRLLDGLLDGLAPTGLTAHRDPTPLNCCVRISPVRQAS